MTPALPARLVAEAGLSECASSGCPDLDRGFQVIVITLVAIPVLIIAATVWYGFSSYAVDVINHSNVTEGSRIRWKWVVVAIPYFGAAAYWWHVRQARTLDRHTPNEVEDAYYADLESANPASAGQGSP